MALILPRLKMSEAAVRILRGMADEKGISIGDLIANILEASMTPRDEIVFRLILVGERVGMGVGGTATFPQDWMTIGGLSRKECRELAAEFLTWKRDLNATTRSKRTVTGSL